MLVGRKWWNYVMAAVECECVFVLPSLLLYENKPLKPSVVVYMLATSQFRCGVKPRVKVKPLRHLKEEKTFVK